MIEIEDLLGRFDHYCSYCDGSTLALLGTFHAQSIVYRYGRANKQNKQEKQTVHLKLVSTQHAVVRKVIFCFKNITNKLKVH